MNSQIPALSPDPQLDQLVGQFAHWRQHRSHPSERIPQALWDQAAALATVIPYSRVAKQLRLSPSALKKHAHDPATPHLPDTHAHLEFYRSSTRLLNLPQSDPETESELARADGARLRLRSGNSTLSLAALVRAFLEAH